MWMSLTREGTFGCCEEGRKGVPTAWGSLERGLGLEVCSERLMGEVLLVVYTLSEFEADPYLDRSLLSP